MGIAKSQFDRILNDIFVEGNYICLFNTVPSEETEAGGVEVTGKSYRRYKIKDGDFDVGEGVVISKENMMMYLCEETSGHGIVKGFGVYTSVLPGQGDMLYFGSFDPDRPMDVTYNTVPTIKKYNEFMDEGVKITMTSTEISVG